MRLFAAATPRQLNIGLTIARVITGAVFAAHGAQKLFVWGPAGVSAGFESMGIPLGAALGPVVGTTELVGGVALALGLLTRPVAAALGVIMLGAMWFVHLPAGFYLPNGYEFVLTLFGSAALFTVVGGGAYSVDAVIAGRRGESAVPSVARGRTGAESPQAA